MNPLKRSLGRIVLVAVLFLDVLAAWAESPEPPGDFAEPERMLLARATAQHLCGCLYLMEKELAFCRGESPLYSRIGERLRVHLVESDGFRTVQTRFDEASGVSRFQPGIGCVTGQTLSRPGNFERKTAPARLTAPWPEGKLPASADKVALERAIRAAFEDPLLQQTRALVIVHDGHIVTERYAPGFDVASRFMSHSIAKFFLGTLAGVLAREHRFDPDSTVALAGWQNPGDPRRTIKAHHLMTMTSGLEWKESYEDLGSDLPKTMFGAGYYHQAAYVASRPSQVSPGAQYYYSSGSSILLAYYLQGAIGPGPAAFVDYVKRKLAGPLSMRSLAFGFDAQGTFTASSWLWATPRDYARLGQMHLDEAGAEGGRFFPEGWTRYMCTPTAQATAEGSGYGAHCVTWWPGELDAVGHGGNEGQALVISPSRKLVVVRFGNLSQPGYEVAMKENLRAIVRAFQTQ